MGALTKIQWCDYTFNPWLGCSRVSPGCKNCYAERNPATRLRGIRWGIEGRGDRKRTSEENWKLPLRWNRQIAHRRPRVFCASLADWLDDAVPIEWLADLLKLIDATPNLDWLLLTKRPQNFTGRLRASGRHRLAIGETGLINGPWNEALWLEGDPPRNVWVGVSVEDQQRADERIPQLLSIPAAVRFLSVEPMLGPVDLTYTCFNGCDSFGQIPGIHWVIFGGESGPGARGCDLKWIRDGVSQCRRGGAVPFVKQLGAQAYVSPEHDGATGFFLPLKDKKGGDPAEWPEELRVREFPQMIEAIHAKKTGTP